MSDLIEITTTMVSALTGEVTIITTMEPAPEPVPEPVPDRVSRFQALAALYDFGLLAEVEAALVGAGVIAQLAWAEAAEFRRNSPTILGLAAGLGLTDAQIDELFRHAAQIEV